MGARVLERELEAAGADDATYRPDRRTGARERLRGVARVEHARTGDRGRVILVDLSEGGVCFVTAIEPGQGDLISIEVGGLVFEGHVRHVVPDGSRYRVGLAFN